MRIQVKVPNSNGVAAGQTATWSLPIGRRYHSLQLEYSGVTLAQMTAIRVIANGEVIHNLTGTQRDTLNQYDKRAAAAGILVIPFDRENLFRQEGEELTAIQTGSADANGIAITDFKLEIDIAAGATPVIAVTATQSDNDPNLKGTGLIKRTLRFTRPLNSVGLNEVSDLPKGTEGSRYRALDRLSIFSAAVSSLVIERSNFKIFERSASLNNRIQVDGVRNPQAGVFVFDPIEEGYDFEVMSFLGADNKPFQDVRYKPTTTATDSAAVFVMEYLGTLQG